VLNNALITPVSILIAIVISKRLLRQSTKDL
jgi:hypothetical protein